MEQIPIINRNSFNFRMEVRDCSPGFSFEGIREELKPGGTFVSSWQALYSPSFPSKL